MLCAALALIFPLFSCAGGPEAGSAAPGAENAAPRYAEIRPGVENREEFTVVFYGGFPRLDPRIVYISSEAQLATALHEGLFSYHPASMAPVPAAARDWRLSEDKKTWTFFIREDARYSNGDPVRAQDFRDTWLSLLAERDSPYSSLFDVIANAKEYRLGSLTNAAKVGIRAVNDRTLEVTLNSPAAFFPYMLCHHSFYPVHPSLLRSRNWDASAPLAVNGPFRLESAREERGETVLTLAKNEQYWDAEKVALSRLVVRYTEDENEPTHYWNSGAARWVAGSVNPDLITDRSGIMVNEIFATHYYFIRSVRAPWQDPRLRRALAVTVPWAALREGIFLPAKTLIYPIPGYPAVNGFEETDSGLGRRLLAEAGYPGGEGLPELVIRITPSEDAARIAGIMAAAWFSELGVRSRMDIVPYGRYFDALRLPDYDVGSTTWIGDFADPYSFLQMWRRDSNLNDAGYHDPDYEVLMDRSMTEEGDKRWKTLAEAETLLLERGAVLPISFGAAVNLISLTEVDGWFPNALDIHPFKYLSFKAWRPLPGVTMHTHNEAELWMR
jgi:peptide/nickel transport system substrate-binding protein/oligopeptide transport system substrate-binding protein